MVAPAGLAWLASFPKSGNTWFRILLANLAAGDSGPADINMLDRDVGTAGSRDMFEAATMLESGLMPHDDIDALRPRIYEGIARDAAELRWMKVHDAYTRLPGGEPLLGSAARAAIYLVRDPRDVAVSLAHHNSTSIDAAIALMNEPDGALCDGPTGPESQLRQKLCGWGGHIASWLDQRSIPVHLTRYEDLRADTAVAFGNALKFVGDDASSTNIERAVRRADFQELQRREREAGFAERKPGASPFFRAGRAGAWREILSVEQCTRIENANAEMMDRLGYARA
jgi:aryl sulfotransferase